MTSIVQKKKKQEHKGMGKEHLTQEEPSYEHGKKEVHDMVKVTDDNEVGPKRKLRSPLKEILMEEDVGKKQKIDREFLVLSKLMAKQLGSAMVTG